MTAKNQNLSDGRKAGAAKGWATRKAKAAKAKTVSPEPAITDQIPGPVWHSVKVPLPETSSASGQLPQLATTLEEINLILGATGAILRRVLEKLGLPEGQENIFISSPKPTGGILPGIQHTAGEAAARSAVLQVLATALRKVV
jgi:hypothetical protein